MLESLELKELEEYWTSILIQCGADPSGITIKPTQSDLIYAMNRAPLQGVTKYRIKELYPKAEFETSERAFRQEIKAAHIEALHIKLHGRALLRCWIVVDVQPQPNNEDFYMVQAYLRYR